MKRFVPWPADQLLLVAVFVEVNLLVLNVTGVTQQC